MESGMAEISLAISRATRKPEFIAMIAIAAVIIITHVDNFDDGPLAKLFPKDSNSTLIKAIRDNEGKFMGLVVFAPVLYEAFATGQTFAIVISAIWLVMSPVVTIYEYAIHASILYLYYHVYSDSARAILIAIALALWYFEWIDLESKPPDDEDTRKWGATCGAATGASSKCPPASNAAMKYCCTKLKDPITYSCSNLPCDAEFPAKPKTNTG